MGGERVRPGNLPVSPKHVAGPDRGRQACRGHQEPLGAGRAAVLDPNTSKGHSDKIKEQSGPALNVSPAQRIVLPCCFPDNLWLSGSHFPSETETRDLETPRIFLLMTANPTTRQSLRSASHVLTHLILMAAFWGTCNHYARLSDENAETYPRSRS